MRISQITRHKKVTIRRNAESLADGIRAKWVFSYNPLLPEIVTAASLAHHGMLDSVERMRLMNVDLSPVPAKHLAALASCVTPALILMFLSSMSVTQTWSPSWRMLSVCFWESADRS